MARADDLRGYALKRRQGPASISQRAPDARRAAAGAPGGSAPVPDGRGGTIRSTPAALGPPLMPGHNAEPPFGPTWQRVFEHSRRAAPIARGVHSLLMHAHHEGSSIDTALLVGLADRDDRDRVELYAGDVRAALSYLRDQLDLVHRQRMMDATARSNSTGEPLRIRHTAAALTPNAATWLLSALSRCSAKALRWR